MYDFLIVGAGLFGAVLAERLSSLDKKVLVVEKAYEVGGMCATEWKNGITVHKYGAHIFRTNHDYIWRYVNRFAKFEPFINTPIAWIDGDVYNLPFNMNTMSKIWGIITPDEAKEKLDADRVRNDSPENLEEFALDKVGRTIYEMFIKEYTEKQWGKKCTDLPASILGRLPIRFTYDNNYYSNKKYQGVPKEGYTYMIKAMLDGITVDVCADYRNYLGLAKHTVFTGSIDEYYDYALGQLDYRSLRFEEYFLNDVENAQGVAVINYPQSTVEYTRSIEHKHFLKENCSHTIISREYPEEYDGTNKRYYPIETADNLMLYRRYADIVSDTIFAGRLGSYKYTDMEQTIQNAMELSLHLRYLD